MKYLRNLSPHGTIYRDILLPNITSLLLSENTLNLQRKLFKFRRGNHVLPQLNIFIAVDDVQSFILLQCTQKLLEKYRFKMKVYLLPIGVNGWSSSIEEKYGWINRDAGLFASFYSLEEPHYSTNPLKNMGIDQSQCSQVTLDIHNIINKSDIHDTRTIQTVLDSLRLVWGKNSDKFISSSQSTDCHILDENRALLKKLGYYNPGAIEFEGEWYPPSRLHHLERRLISEGFNTSGDLLFDKEKETTTSICHGSSQPFEESSLPLVEVFYSFRSPYSQLVAPRLKKICAKYSCRMAIRPLLPMVTRGLAVPPEKEHYIALDSAREARLWNIPFGKIIDPLHPKRLPFLRALDAFEIASECGLEVDFVESYGYHQWGNGVSAGTDSGLRTMMRDAKMNEEQMIKVFKKINATTPEERFAYWENKTAENRSYILSRGLWGVPCIKYKDIILFGQDKIWAIEKIISIDRLKEKGERIQQNDEKLYEAIVKYAGT